MFAGPNGSGKSTLIRFLRDSVPLGPCLNPDEVEQHWAHEGQCDFDDWNLHVDATRFHAFMMNHGLAGKLTASIPEIHNNSLQYDHQLHGTYFTSMLCDFIRQQWIAHGESFTFETVMSHESKVQLLEEARRAGYRTYLYYICTDSPIINKERVTNRVVVGGHPVEPEKIVNRYHRSLLLLRDAIALSNRAYLFDNSGKGHRYIAEFEDGKLVSATPNQPNWSIKHALGVVQ